MNIKEAMQTAITYEKRVRDAYQQAMKQAQNPEIKKILGALAHDEHDHLRYLQDSYKLWRDTGQLHFEVLKSEIDWIALRGSLDAVLETLKPMKSASGSLRQAVEQAHAVEQETHDFYVGLLSGLRQNLKPIFERFVKSEADHLAVVGKLLESLQNKT
ncbi:MAG: ferritin family protein [Candidatus Alcyoniella australis]|nr:ferritin family protein [Candidatus Alcyoniella australis]